MKATDVRVADEMLVAALKQAVEDELIPYEDNVANYSYYVGCIKRIIEAALEEMDKE